jgi:hypothetical protein
MKTSADSAGSAAWIGETCAHVPLKTVVKSVMILHSIQITCGLAGEGFEDLPRGHYLNCAIKVRALAHEEAVRRESDVTTDSVCSHPHLDP